MFYPVDESIRSNRVYPLWWYLFYTPALHGDDRKCLEIDLAILHDTVSYDIRVYSYNTRVCRIWKHIRSLFFLFFSLFFPPSSPYVSWGGPGRVNKIGNSVRITSGFQEYVYIYTLVVGHLPPHNVTQPLKTDTLAPKNLSVRVVYIVFMWTRNVFRWVR